MPKRDDIKKVMIIGSGPIVISQACEFDYSGTQACKALREEGIEVVLVNSNPATIMTDPDMADRTYIEPILPEFVAAILERERPDALLPTLGGQTALNTALQVAETGVLDRLGIEMIGATPEVIRKAEGREEFREAMKKIGLRVPKSAIIRYQKQLDGASDAKTRKGAVDEAAYAAAEIGYPVIIRPAYTLGGTGGGVAYNVDDLKSLTDDGLAASLTGEVMIEESVIGWKEFELEVMRDKKDNVVIICSIENFDPMGVHTGDSITVAPIQTLTDREYQVLRDASLAIIREIGVETGGSNIQFATHPGTGELVVIEMNPRVSRSSALASKATGFPIARIAAKLAIGYTLDEIPNEITRETMASFEPTIDYCVTKIPRWTFEKFPGSEDVLTTSMKSVGEAMSIGRTFVESFQKGLRSLEIGRYGLGADGGEPRSPDGEPDLEAIRRRLVVPNSQRAFYTRYALEAGLGVDEVAGLTGIDPWFLYQVADLLEFEAGLKRAAETPARGGRLPLGDELFREAKRHGFSDRQLGHLFNLSEDQVRADRRRRGIDHVFKLVDTCAAEFEAYTPYYYSTYEFENEVRASDKRKVVILGGGPNRIGQGIEFDYCCVHASFALREMGIESIMVNSNPETVSTDYDTSDRLYFEPLTKEDVLNIIESERPEGVIVQFGGQTPLNLSVPLAEAGAPILGTPPDAIDRAEDRKRFQVLLQKLGLTQPANDTAFNADEAAAAADRIGYPVVVRPSYVLGGRGMEIVYDRDALEAYFIGAAKVSPDHPILIDKFLEEAIEIDVDAVSDGHRTIVAGVMQHIEEAGIHSGDSACVLPPHTLDAEIVEQIRADTRALAAELGVKGLMNIQFAVKAGEIFVIEVNPRASRTVPFVSKATGVPWAKVATKVMLGMTLDELGLTGEVTPGHYSVKEAVFPFARFPGVDAMLGPEMRSTGEVMGIDFELGEAYAKSQLGAGQILPRGGRVFVSVKDADKEPAVGIARNLADMGFGILATSGTALTLESAGVNCRRVNKVSQARPHIVDLIVNGEVQLVINTSVGKGPQSDATLIRRAAVDRGIPYVTTVAAALATVGGIEAIRRRETTVMSIQEYHERIEGRPRMR